MRKPEEVRPLRIAVIGYNYEQTRMALEDFIYNNREMIHEINKYRATVTLKDGTSLSIINDITNVIDSDFDQLMVCDDYRWHVYKNRELLINAVMSKIKLRSCVPEDFQVIRYKF